jgi:Sulfotransferase family
MPNDSRVEPPFLFIFGCGRSGTTMLRSMFDSHPGIAIPGESGFIWQARKRHERRTEFDVHSFVDSLLSHRRFQKWGLDAQSLRAAMFSDPPVEDFAAAIRRLYRLFADARGKERYGDKTPGHVLRLPLIASMFPEGRFVHLVRDGRDVTLSYMDIKEWGPASVPEAALYWKRRVQYGRRKGRALGPTRYTEVRYEDLVADPEAELRRLCGFASLAFHDEMLRYFERAGEVLDLEMHPHRHQGIHRPPTAGLRDWRTKMNDEDVSCFEVLAGDALTEFGYERRYSQTTASMQLKSRVGAGKAGMAKFERFARSATRRFRSRVGVRRSPTGGR